MAVAAEAWAASHPALELEAGEVVAVGRRDETWPEYLWCAAAGGEGWVPDAVLALRGDGTAVVRFDYSTAELSVEPGDRLRVIERLAGWSWCEDAAGRRGWVPDRVLVG